MTRPTEATSDLPASRIFTSAAQLYRGHQPGPMGTCSCGHPGCRARYNASRVIEAAGVNPATIAAANLGPQSPRERPLAPAAPDAGSRAAQEPAYPTDDASVADAVRPALPGGRAGGASARPPADRGSTIQPGRPPLPIRSRMRASSDPYLLRALIWCASCDLRMLCTVITTQQVIGGIDAAVPVRTYRCVRDCRQGHVRAEAAESVVWTAAERRATISDILPPYRQSVLETLVARVVVGATTDDISCVWAT